MTTPLSIALLPCPFCGMVPPEDLIDTLYPSGIYWREIEGGIRHYFHNGSVAEDGHCYSMNCTTNEGGCGAEISGDSKKETIAAWNRRALSAQPEQPPDHWVSVTGHGTHYRKDLSAIDPEWQWMWKGLYYAAPEQPQPISKEVVAWVRRHPDGALSPNELLSDERIEESRKKSGAWVPLCRCEAPAQAEKPTNPNCQAQLMAAGRPYPRTCKTCGLGPCKN